MASIILRTLRGPPGESVLYPANHLAKSPPARFCFRCRTKNTADRYQLCISIWLCEQGRAANSRPQEGRFQLGIAILHQKTRSTRRGTPFDAEKETFIYE